MVKETLETKTVEDVKKEIEKLTAKHETFHKEVNVTGEQAGIIQQAATLRAKIELLDAELKSLNAQYAPLREQILEMLPGAPADKVEAIVDGVLIKKHSQVKGAGKIDSEKMLSLLKSKKLLTKTTRTVRVIDEKMVLNSIAEGHLTPKEYVGCLTKGNISEVLKIQRKFYAKPTAVVNEKVVEFKVPQ